MTQSECIKMFNVGKVFSFVVLCLVSLTNGIKEGDKCIVPPDIKGVCRNLTECAYADQQIHIEMKRPTHCAWHPGTDDEVVCCPDGNQLHRLGPTAFRAAFGATTDGVIRSDNMVCRYDGRVPVRCCEDKHNDRPEPEPEHCPKLPQPRKEIAHIAWKKCVEFQRYAKVCERSDSVSDQYVRRDACVMDDFVDKVAGGNPARPKEFPHMALLGCKDDSDPNQYIVWIGGGTLISERFVLTAAHVISHARYGLVQYVLMGTVAKSTAREGVLQNVVRYHKHKFYKASEKYYDIALLELESRVIFSDFIRPACLALPEMNLSDTRIIAGWGETGGTWPGKTSDILLKAAIMELNTSSCVSRIDTQGLPKGYDRAGMICAGADTAADSCHGDSGGPLMAYMNDLDCSYAVRGIVSWGPQCGEGSPGVYTNVHNYLDWIVERVWPS